MMHLPHLWLDRCNPAIQSVAIFTRGRPTMANLCSFLLNSCSHLSALVQVEDPESGCAIRYALRLICQVLLNDDGMQICQALG